MDGVGADAVGAFGSRIESSGRAHIADRDEACRRPVGHPPRDRLRHARFAPSERVGSLRTLAIRVRWDERGTWRTWGSCQCYPALLLQARLNQARRWRASVEPHDRTRPIVPHDTQHIAHRSHARHDTPFHRYASLYACTCVLFHSCIVSRRERASRRRWPGVPRVQPSYREGWCSDGCLVVRPC